MKDKISILCCCGAGICTSNYLREEIGERMKQEGIKNVKVTLCRVNDVEEAIANADMMVTTVEMKANYPVPMIRALGIMLDDKAAKKALDEIVMEVRKLQR
ncbi:phosphotransferase system eiib component type 2/3 [Lucifera butyrica]|uniref:Phosphotransferase system eiib component type 2/3 n=1 Tax=Lucifera butyrica TaxID=1351585 RepID=A0A498R8L9_9FIRM|nr:PTS sugar transporter [Lucifera butyrica]VBB07270.1 phosphotransferase system eiib component type 2/3 [Lucifera butyrica]